MLTYFSAVHPLNAKSLECCSSSSSRHSVTPQTNNSWCTRAGSHAFVDILLWYVPPGPSWATKQAVLFDNIINSKYYHKPFNNTLLFYTYINIHTHQYKIILSLMVIQISVCVLDLVCAYLVQRSPRSGCAGIRLFCFPSSKVRMAFCTQLVIK